MEKKVSKLKKEEIVLRVIKIINVIIMAGFFAAVWYLYYAERAIVQYYNKGNWLVVFIFAVSYYIFGRVYDAFQISLNKISETVYSQGLALVIANGIIYIMIWLLSLYRPSVFPLLITLACQILCSVIWTTLAEKWYFATFQPRKTVIVFDMREGLEKLVTEYGLDKKYKVTKTMPVEECLKDLNTLNDFEAIFISGVHSHERNIILKHCMYRGICTYVIPRVGDVIMSSAYKLHMFHLPMLRVERYKPVPEYLFMKRAFDLLVSIVALIITSPIMLVTAVAIKTTDGGPIFYKQCRLTKDGRKFNVLKFRSMRVDAEKDGVARLSTGAKDSRVTPVGRVIRKVRIDELPQLFNIISGDMSIVGPRPERPEIAAQYEEVMPEFALRLQAKAGLTGYAQVYGKYNTDPYDKLQMDLMYIASPSFIEDLRICFATVKILFIPESTEGIQENATTAMNRKE